MCKNRATIRATAGERDTIDGRGLLILRKLLKMIRRWESPAYRPARSVFFDLQDGYGAPNLFKRRIGAGSLQGRNRLSRSPLPFRRGYAAGPFDAIHREVRVRIHFLQVLRMLFDKIGQETCRSADGRSNVIEEPGDNVSCTDVAEVLPNVFIGAHPVISGRAAPREKSQNSRPPKDEPVVRLCLRTDEIEQGASLGVFNSVERTVIYLRVLAGVGEANDDCDENSRGPLLRGLGPGNRRLQPDQDVQHADRNQRNEEAVFQGGPQQENPHVGDREGLEDFHPVSEPHYKPDQRQAGKKAERKQAKRPSCNRCPTRPRKI